MEIGLTQFVVMGLHNYNFNASTRLNIQLNYTFGLGSARVDELEYATLMV